MSDHSDRLVRHLRREVQQLQRDNVDLVSRIAQLQRIALEHNTIVSPVDASPSSSLSSLPTLTPSPPASPLQASAPPMANVNANIQAIDDFAGDEAPPGPTKWMQSIRIALGPSISDDDALFFFELKLVHGKPADNWFQSLPAPQKDTWTHLRTAFQIRWPPTSAPSSQVAVLRDRLERDVLTEEEAMREEDGTYGYVCWVRRVRQIARELEDPHHHLLAGVVNKLPYAIYRNLPTGSQTTWDLFETAITDLPLRAVEGSFLEMRTQDAMLEWSKQQTTAAAAVLPSPPIRYSPYRPAAQPQPNGTPPTAPMINIASATPRTPQRPPFQQYASTPQAPSTGATTFWQGAGRGRGAGNLFPRPPATPLSPTPPRPPQQQQQQPMLTPGSAPLGSRECWVCGQQGHTRHDCQNPNPLPMEEQLLRRQAGQAALDRARQIHQLSAFPAEETYAYDTNWMPGNA